MFVVGCSVHLVDLVNLVRITYNLFFIVSKFN